MTFRNSVVGGTVLVRSAIESQNFVTGATGWQIKADGTAEFNNVIIRGGTVISGTSLYYDGPPAAGNLILSLSATAGTDSYGNAYVKGVGVYNSSGDQIQLVDSDLTLTGADGSTVILTANGFYGNGIYQTPPAASDGSSVWEAGAVVADFSSGTPDSPYLSIYSPFEDSHATAATIVLTGADANDNPTSIDLNADTVSVPSGGGDFNVGGASGTTIVNGGLIGTYDGQSWTSFTPTVTGGGTATFTVQQGTRTRIGNSVFFRVYLVVNAAGSGAANIAIAGPATIERDGGTTRQVISGNAEGLTANNGTVSLVALVGGSGAVWDRLRGPTGTNIMGAMLANGAIITLQGWMMSDQF